MVFSTLNQSFAFHSSPELFISARLQELSAANASSLPAASNRHSIVQASILNRKVHIISSYRLCKEILGGTSEAARTPATSDRNTAISASSEMPHDMATYAVGPAYHQLMSDFFPPPNILLEDGALHTMNKSRWKNQLSTFPADTVPLIREITLQHLTTLHPGTTLDLYENLKDLAWKLLLGIFLDLQPKDDAYSAIEKAQEDLLRGQFSLFPLTVNMPFWQSPRARGIDARHNLQNMLRGQMNRQESSCPLFKQNEISKDEMSSHALLFTSSIANKGLASLMTATIMNLFLYPHTTPVSVIRSQPSGRQQALLESIVLETERLSPPVVGVMRRVQKEVKLPLDDTDQRHCVPAGCDVWLYFTSANRDPAVYPEAESFLFDRYMSKEAPRGLSFGFGSKHCLGSEIVHQIVVTVAETMIEKDITLHGSIDDLGVKGWLGWTAGVSPTAFAKDLKQLPCQRPRKPVQVTVGSV
ncbi:hypothetical protein MMC13_007453 [Lambiella insularis]|nr:hypothetical protein [Lambiella insularis]